MRFFYKKDYYALVKIVQEKQKTINELEELNTKLTQDLIEEVLIKEEKSESLDTLTLENAELNKTIDNMQKDYLDLDSKKNIIAKNYRKLLASNGGLTKQVNKLTKENEALNETIKELQKKLEESMTDKYVVKKLKPQKTPNIQKTKVSKTIKPNVMNYMKKEFD